MLCIVKIPVTQGPSIIWKKGKKNVGVYAALIVGKNVNVDAKKSVFYSRQPRQMNCNNHSKVDVICAKKNTHMRAVSSVV